MRVGAFRRVGRLRKGYHRKQVDAFLGHVEVALSGALPLPTAVEVRRAGFELVRGGYDTTAVDEALDALEERVLLVQGMAAGGRALADPVGEVDDLRAGLSTPYMKRFPRAGALRRGYDVDDVDELVDTLVTSLDGTGPAVSVEDVRSACFRPRRGGYREHDVDEMLDRVVELLLVLRHGVARPPSGPAAP